MASPAAPPREPHEAAPPALRPAGPERPSEIERLPRARPTDRAVAAAGILAFLDAVALAGIELHSFMLYRAGAVVAEGYWRPYGPERPHMLHSATKSWTATAVGIAIGEGRLALGDRVIGFFPDRLPATVPANLAAMTVEDLLTMRTGHRTGISGGEWRGLAASWVEAFLREPVGQPPGRDFIYSSATSYMLSAIVTAVTGETVRDYLEPRLLRPLGIGSLTWDLSPEGVNTGGNGVACTTEDFLKLGVLHLDGGLWMGGRVLPGSWVAAATRNQVAEAWLGDLDARRFKPRGESEAEKRDGYGYQWWMTKHGGYLASGNYGQHCIVLPAQDAVVAFTGGLALRERRHLEALWDHLLPALGAEGSSADDARLRDRLDGLALPGPQGAPRSPAQAEIGGRAYAFEPNADGLVRASFRFADDACRVTLVDGRGEHVVDVGIGRAREGETSVTGDVLHHGYQPDRMRVSAEGAWSGPDTFRMIWRFVEMAFADTVVCTFEGDALRLDRSVNTNAGPLARPTIHGRATDGRRRPGTPPNEGRPGSP